MFVRRLAFSGPARHRGGNKAPRRCEAAPDNTPPVCRSPPSMPPAFSVSTASLDGTHLDVDGANTKLRVRSFALGDLNTLAVGCPVQADAGAVAAAACSFYVYNHRCVAECLDGKVRVHCFHLSFLGWFGLVGCCDCYGCCGCRYVCGGGSVVC